MGFGLHGTSTTSGTGMNINSSTTVNPTEDVFGMGKSSVLSYETKDRAIQEYLETLSKSSMLVQFEARSRERLAILPDTVTCSRSLQHTACSLHSESGMYEISG